MDWALNVNGKSSSASKSLTLNSLGSVYPRGFKDYNKYTENTPLILMMDWILWQSNR